MITFKDLKIGDRVYVYNRQDKRLCFRRIIYIDGIKLWLSRPGEPGMYVEPLFYKQNSEQDYRLPVHLEDGIDFDLGCWSDKDLLIENLRRDIEREEINLKAMKQDYVALSCYHEKND